MNNRKSVIIICLAILASIILGFLVFYYLESIKFNQEKPTQVTVKTSNKPKAKEPKKAKPVKKPTKPKQKVEKKKPAAKSSCNSSTVHADPNQIDVIANKKHCLNPLRYVPKDLVQVNKAWLRKEAASHYRKMLTDANKSKASFWSISSYRSYDNQVVTYNHWVNTSGRKKADTYSARPGYSEHQTGLTVDLASGQCRFDCFEKTKAHAWLTKNGHKYGFIKRYPKGKERLTGYIHESWHWRYIGIEAATDMKQKGVKTLEEYWGIEGGDYPG